MECAALYQYGTAGFTGRTRKAVKEKGREREAREAA
jgi:hypothetical protein